MQQPINHSGCGKNSSGCNNNIFKWHSISAKTFTIGKTVPPEEFISWRVTVSAKDLAVAEIRNPISDPFGKVFNVDLVSELWEENLWDCSVYGNDPWALLVNNPSASTVQGEHKLHASSSTQ